MTPSLHLLLSTKYLLSPIQCCMIAVKDFLKETVTLVGGRGGGGVKKYRAYKMDDVSTLLTLIEASGISIEFDLSSQSV